MKPFGEFFLLFPEGKRVYRFVSDEHPECLNFSWLLCSRSRHMKPDDPVFLMEEEESQFFASYLYASRIVSAADEVASGGFLRVYIRTTRK